MKRITIFIFLIATAIAAAAFAAGTPQRPAGPPPQQGQGGPGGGPGATEVLPPALLAEFLGLTEAQKEQVHALAETLRTTVEPLHDQIEANRGAIEEALEAGNAQKAGELLLANYTLREQIAAAREAFMTSFEALLTADQKAKFEIYREIVDLRRSHGPRE